MSPTRLASPLRTYSFIPVRVFIFDIAYNCCYGYNLITISKFEYDNQSLEVKYNKLMFWGLLGFFNAQRRGRGKERKIVFQERSPFHSG